MFQFLGGRGRHEHHHAAAFGLGLLVNDALARKRLGEAVMHIEAQIGVRHFAATEPDGYLELVALRQELGGLVDLGVEVVGVDVERQADLLDFHDFLVLLGFFFPFLHFKTVLAVVQDLAHRRLGLRGDLDQVKVLVHGHAQRVARGHDAHLGTIGADQADLLVADALVDLQFFGIAAGDWNTPPIK